jgi:hypothetical protein
MAFSFNINITGGLEFGQKRNRFDAGGPAEHIHGLDLFGFIAVFEEERGIPGQGGRKSRLPRSCRQAVFYGYPY